MKDLWKRYDEVELTHSSVHHLMAMYELLNKQGYVRGVDIAKYLQISRSSVSITLRKLIARGYVVEDDNKFYLFTKHGEELINSVLSKRKIIRLFFENVLHLDPETAEAEACKIEHLLGEETGQKLMSFMGYYLSDRKTVKQFHKQYKEFRFECSDTDNCDVCETECYYKSTVVADQS
jgi:DtxR family Mn-dependent transcriptional regulator